jgi:hypothetical protein
VVKNESHTKAYEGIRFTIFDMVPVPRPNIAGQRRVAIAKEDHVPQEHNQLIPDLKLFACGIKGKNWIVLNKSNQLTEAIP